MSPGAPDGGPPVVALIGPTGSGKSAVAMAAAIDAGAQIVAIDAFTVYRQLTIGTAKPPAADRAAVPHHMVDRLDVEQDCTVQWFQQQARRAIEEVRAAGDPVLLVGGSGLYFRAVVDPMRFPPTDPELRQRIEAEVAPDPAASHARLAASDPQAADRIDPLNVRRITRALEVAALTGQPFSSFATAWDRFDPIYPSLQVIGLQLDRQDVVDRIDRRVAAMLEAGWVEECRALAHRELSTSAAQAIGYAELLAWLADGEDPQALPAVAQRIAIRTRQFANRQRRWFAGDPRVQWTAPPGAARLVSRALGATTVTTPTTPTTLADDRGRTDQRGRVDDSSRSEEDDEA